MSQSLSTTKQRVPRRSPEHTRPRTAASLVWRAAALLSATAFIAVGGYAIVTRSIEDVSTAFTWAPLHIVPEGHRAQVAAFRALVPAGSWVIYADDRPEAWQSGLWQRSLYPDYVVYRVAGDSQLDMIVERARSLGHPVRQVIAPTRYTPKRAFVRSLPLPDYPGGIPLRIGMWSE